MILKNKIALSLILTVMVTITIKLILPVHKSNKEITDEFWFEKTHSESKVNIVVGGNSRIYRGVSINKLLGSLNDTLSGVNLGYSSCGFSTDYLDFLLSRLDLKSENKIIVLGVTPGSLTDKAAKNEHFHQFKDISQSELIKSSYLKKYANLSPYKPLELINIFKKRNGYIEEEKGYFSRYNPDGWVASYKFPSDSTEAISKYQKYYSPNDVIINKEMVDKLILKIEEFISMDIQVIAFRPPTTYQMEALEDKLLGFDEELIKSELERVGAYWFDVNTADFESYDGSHLHYLSAEKLSVQLGERINQVCLSNSIK